MSELQKLHTYNIKCGYRTTVVTKCVPMSVYDSCVTNQTHTHHLNQKQSSNSSYCKSCGHRHFQSAEPRSFALACHRSRSSSVVPLFFVDDTGLLAVLYMGGCKRGRSRDLGLYLQVQEVQNCQMQKDHTKVNK